MNNFWTKIKKPVICLAPMADVTDSAFRFIIAKYSKIQPFDKLRANHFVIWTEFVSADGLALAPEKGRQKLLKDLEYSEIERPIVAQFFTSKPENMEKAARLALELGFDGVDINMGCPDKSIEKQGAGAALIKNPSLAKEIILAAKQGATPRQAQGHQYLPVSVKTRIGYNKNELETWLPHLLETTPAVITIHARTRKEMSLVPARWEHVKRAVEIRDEIQNFPPPHTQTLIFGNGDVASVEEAEQKVAETGADGVMLGRAIFGNPFLFAGYEPTWQERLNVLVEHTNLFAEKLGNVKNFAVMKKHFKSYLSYVSKAKDDPAWHHAVKNLREELMFTNNASEVEKIVESFLNVYN